MLISVITPTARGKEAIRLVEKALNRQTFTGVEWIIGSPTKPSNLDFPFVWVKDPPKQKNDTWTLNKCYNSMIKKAKGDLIVSWQDYTYAKPDTLEKFAFHFQEEPKTLVGAVGNKYQDETWRVEVWRDPRKRLDQGTYYPCYFSDIEWNLASIPKEALYAVGGFDQFLDQFYGMDGYSVNERIHLIGGYDFKLDQLIESFSLEHGRPDKWEEKNAIHGPYQTRVKDYLCNPKLNYLK